MPKRKADNNGTPPAKKAKAERLSVKFAEQVAEVKKNVLSSAFVNPATVDSEVEWFYDELGFDPFYFETVAAATIARHIQHIYSAKLLAHLNEKQSLDIDVREEQEDHALYVFSSYPGARVSRSSDVEVRLESLYLSEGYEGSQTNNNRFRVQAYRSTGFVTGSKGQKQMLRIFFADRPEFVEENPTGEFDIRKCAAKKFLARSGQDTLDAYSNVIQEVLRNGGVASRISPGSSGGHRLRVAYKSGSTHSFLSGMSTLYHYYNFYSRRKYIEHFSCGVTVISVHLFPVDANCSEEEMKTRLSALEKDLSLTYVLPRTGLTPMLQDHTLSAKEVTYAYAAWKFTHHFLEAHSSDSAELKAALKSHPLVFEKVRARLGRNQHTEGLIKQTLLENAPVIKLLYKHFASLHDPDLAKNGAEEAAAVRAAVKRMCGSDEFACSVLDTFVNFNVHVLRTNLYKQTKTALSFRLDPAFLRWGVKENEELIDYPVLPFGVFFMLGSEFRGFHVRFADVARGGVRMIQSRDISSYAKNVASLFDENYGLANTQQRKNKDIPEGGSKGTVLLTPEHQDKAKVAFEKWVDALLDLMLCETEPAIVDRLKRKEIIFLGPDEGTADFMDWACLHAKKRGASTWKGFTTGKSLSLGGIPHDVYGMTTRSVHEFVLGCLRKMGLEESSVRKAQTGGPDGDLGSNEILISEDKTTTIIDGTGTLYDPDGIDKEALRALARKRQPVQFFDKKKLSKKGFLVLVSDRDVTLPDGTHVDSGLDLRNGFHLDPRISCDVFVPCGGRPAAVNIRNMQSVFHEDGTPYWRIVVEGANLFFTQDARLALEKAGVVLIKDASANKGGVTSSSLEVLASLAFDDEGFQKHMCQPEGSKTTDFYAAYVKDVQAAIMRNAQREFECLWRAHEETKRPRCILSDDISERINRLTEQIEGSKLWFDMNLRKKILSECLPPTLVKMLGYDAICKNVPENYLRAMFGSYLASTYVYTYGLTATEFSFLDFMQKYM